MFQLRTNLSHRVIDVSLELLLEGSPVRIVIVSLPRALWRFGSWLVLPGEDRLPNWWPPQVGAGSVHCLVGTHSTIARPLLHCASAC